MWMQTSVFLCHWSRKGGNKHPYRERIIWLRARGLTVAIYCGGAKERPQRVQPIWSLNRAVTNSSDNPVSSANIGPECLKVNGDCQALCDESSQTDNLSACPQTFSCQIMWSQRSEIMELFLFIYLFFSFLFPLWEICTDRLTQSLLLSTTTKQLKIL